MPTYQYVCSKCGHAFELFQSMSDEPITVCPKETCARKKWGRGAVKRQIGAGAGLIFKGSGFYITDYRSSNYKEAAKRDSSSTAATSDSKPAAASGGGGSPSTGGKSGNGTASAPKSESKTTKS